MPALLIGSLTIAIATTIGPTLTPAIALPADTTEFGQAELISQRYTYRQFQGGTGRREILS
jgi:hypothetical protein